MKNRGITVVNHFTDVKQIDSKLLELINLKTKNALFDETISIFNLNNKLLYNYSIDKKNDTIPDALLNNLGGSDLKFKIGRKDALGFVYSLKGKQFKVVISAYDQYGIDNLKNLRIILLIGTLISIFASYAAGWFFAGHALRPISRIINDVNEITISKLNLRLNEGNKHDEIAQLSITFNRMLDRLEKGFEMQRSFVSNASHELRTPLTAITGHIEVTLKKERSQKEYVELLESLLKDIKKLNKMSNNLLDLALATTDVGTLKLTNIRIDEILFSARDKLMKNFPDYIVSISCGLLLENEKYLIIFGNETLIESAFFNIMENACKFSSNKMVEVNFEADIEKIALLFKDKGIGIPKDEIPKIVEPFYRATNAINKPGSGLGLSLSQKIIELHAGTLNIYSEVNKGTSIQIILPHNKDFNDFLILD